MARTPIPLPSSTYTSPSKMFSSQRLINWVPHYAEGGSIAPFALFRRPGEKLFTDVTDSVNRGSITVNEIPYFINGNRLKSVTSAGVVTDHGNIDGSGRVSLAKNDRYLVIVIPGVKAYVYDTQTTTLSLITDLDFRLADTVDFISGFFVFSATAGDVYFVSEINDPFNYNALDFGSAELNPDNVNSVKRYRNELLVGGSGSIEVFRLPQVPPTSGSPFVRIESASVQTGVRAVFSLIEHDNILYFVGGDSKSETGIYQYAGGGATTKISTDAMDSAISKFTENEISKAFSMSFQIDGQSIVLFTFESFATPGKTFCLNITASRASGKKVWFEMQTGGEDNSWSIQSITRAYNKFLIADKTSNIGELDRNTYDSFGDPILHVAITQPFYDNNQPLFVSRMETLWEFGVGLGDGSETIVRLSFSDDGGKSFGNEIQNSIGKIGEYSNRCFWDRLGRFPTSRCIRIRASTKTELTLIGLTADVEGSEE